MAYANSVMFFGWVGSDFTKVKTTLNALKLLDQNNPDGHINFYEDEMKYGKQAYRKPNEPYIYIGKQFVTQTSDDEVMDHCEIDFSEVKKLIDSISLFVDGLDVPQPKLHLLTVIDNQWNEYVSD